MGENRRRERREGRTGEQMNTKGKMFIAELFTKLSSFIRKGNIPRSQSIPEMMDILNPLYIVLSYTSRMMINFNL